ncbi:MAG: endolytic transglycosylase MltG, partial [Calditerrivibrio sp.]|nr:endolytic transglycosylase MltG [Calditerrivibrio sp.]
MFGKIALIILLPIFLVTFFSAFFIYKAEDFINNTKISRTVKIEKNEKYSVTYEKIFGGIDTPPFFQIYLRKVKKFPEKIKFGYYEADNITIAQFIKNIEEGKESRFKITIPEGYTIYDIANRLKDLNIMNSKRFLELVTDSEFIFKLTGERLNSLEGFLYPDSYFVTTDLREEEFIAQIYKNF